MADGGEGGFVVFISYKSADRAAVLPIAESLRRRGLRVFLDKWYLTPGQPWIEALEHRLDDCRAVSVCCGPDGMGDWQKREIWMALDRQAKQKGFPVIPVLLPKAGDPALGFLKLNTWVDLRDGVEDPQRLEILARAVRGLPPGPDEAPDPRRAICPYRGLLPFREEDAEYFCGRQAFVDALVDKVRRHPLVALVGASGSGKSSVVHAGLVPALRRRVDGRVWEALTLEPGRQPLHALIRAFSPAREDGASRSR